MQMMFHPLLLTEKHHGEMLSLLKGLQEIFEISCWTDSAAAITVSAGYIAVAIVAAAAVDTVTASLIGHLLLNILDQPNGFGGRSSSCFIFRCIGSSWRCIGSS